MEESAGRLPGPRAPRGVHRRLLRAAYEPRARLAEGLRLVATMAPRGVFPAKRMDRSSLRGFADELAASERCGVFAAAFPADARVSEAALPLVLATLFATLGTPLVCLFPEDEHACDAADAIAWYVDPDAVGLFPSRGVQP